jgi:hypothetical protein
LNQKFSLREGQIPERDVNRSICSSDSKRANQHCELPKPRSYHPQIWAATAVAMLNGAEATLDEALSPITNDVANHLNDNFSRLFEGLVTRMTLVDNESESRNP